MNQDIGSSYAPPDLVAGLGKLLSFTRKGYSTDFAQFVVSDSPSSTSYWSGLVVIAAVMGGFALLWLCILVAFKCTAASMGCAGGKPFLSDDQLRGVSSGSGSTDEESASGLSQSEQDDDVSYLDEDSFQSSIRSSELDDTQSILQSENNRRNDECSVSSDAPFLPSRRERRTQLVFFFMSLVALICVPLVLIYCYAPLVKETDLSREYLGDARDIILAVDDSVAEIENTFNSSKELVDTLKSTSFSDVCPLVDTEELNDSLGVNLDAMLQIFADNYDTIEQQVRSNITDYAEIANGMTEMIDNTQNIYNISRDYLWLLPLLMLLVCATIAMAVFGVLMSRNGNSSRRLQQGMSYFVLPALLLLSLVLWVLAISTAVTSAVGSDACSQGSSDGSPSNTFTRILDLEGFDPSSILYQQAVQYSMGCVNDGTLEQILKDLESSLQSTIDLIWRYLSTVDAAGASNVIALCGSDNINSFGSDARNGARQLTALRKSIRAIRTSLSCSRVYSIYIEAVEDSTCTEVSLSVGWAFILFSVMGIATLAMISMRASWLQRLNEEKIYDEDDVAENMLVDEHEEYLAYISHYRHEWQEYGGLDRAIDQPVSEEGSTESDLCSLSEGSSSRPSNGSLTTESDASGSFAEQFDPYINSDTEVSVQSVNTSISFQSLQELQKKNASVPVPLLGGPSSSTASGDLDDESVVDVLLDVDTSEHNIVEVSNVSPRKPHPRASNILKELDRF